MVISTNTGSKTNFFLQILFFYKQDCVHMMKDDQQFALTSASMNSVDHFIYDFKKNKKLYSSNKQNLATVISQL